MGAVQCSCQNCPKERESHHDPASVDAVPILDDEPGRRELPCRPTLLASVLDDEPSVGDLKQDLDKLSDSDDICNDDCELAELVENTELELIGKECALTRDDNTVGDHVCERAQDESCVQAFQQEDVLTKLLKIVADRVLQNHSGGAPQEDVLASLHGTKGTTTLAFSVSDPAVKDCPLMYVSSGFENATGYNVDFATGRSCRFLQPTSATLNNALNLNDRKLMRDFCKEPLPEGTLLVNLLLNERYDGRRFWNLLMMEHVNVDGKIYIFAVQSVVDSYMPKLLRRAVKDTATDKKNQKVVDELGKFLKRLKILRSEIAGSKQPISELSKHVQLRLKEIKAKSEKASAKRTRKK